MASPPDIQSAELSRDVSSAGPIFAPGAFGSALNFLRARWLACCAISAVVLVPCFWHTEIEAADLGSHLYNAWLVELIHHGQVHGLWIDHRWNNILFDYLLAVLGTLFGLHAAEKVAVSLAVLIFFWGTFALVCAAARRIPWYVLPLVAMAAYGWTFHIGLFNYYLALGLSFFALAILWRGRPAEWIIALALAPLIVLAHPLALLWLVGAGTYVVVAERVPRVYHVGLLLAGIAALFGIHEYLWAHYVVEARPNNFWFFNGADQFVLFGERYRTISYVFLALVAAAIVWNLLGISERGEILRMQRDKPGAPGGLRSSQSVLRRMFRYAISFELYLLVFAAVLLLPRGAHVPGHIGAVALLTDRLTSVSVVLLICLIAAARPQSWYLLAGVALAGVFFAFAYQDTRRINRMETQVAKLVRTLPRGARVMGTIPPPPGWRVTIQHILDRACIGYCFSYGNYEPGSKMFRVRAEPGDPYVLANYDLAIEMERGTYVVRPKDLPVWEVYPCTASSSAAARYGSAADSAQARFCIIALHAGESNLPTKVDPGPNHMEHARP